MYPTFSRETYENFNGHNDRMNYLSELRNAQRNYLDTQQRATDNLLELVAQAFMNKYDK